MRAHTDYLTFETPKERAFDGRRRKRVIVKVIGE
jgi:hypothetical protein